MKKPFYSSAAALLFLIAPFATHAAVPVLIGEYGEDFDALVADGPRVWACDYRPAETTPGLFRLLADGQDASSEEAQAFPPGVWRMAAAPDGGLYAVAAGPESGTNPSMHLWRKAGAAAWEYSGLLRSADPHIGVESVRIGFANGRVVVNFGVTWSSYDGGGAIVTSGPPDIPALAIFDPATATVSFGPTGFESMTGDGDGVLLYGVKPIPPDWMMERGLFRSSDGINWEPIAYPDFALNDPTPPLVFGTPPYPVHASGGRIFFNAATSAGGPFGGGVGPPSVTTPGGVALRYPLPFAENGYGASGPEIPEEERYDLPRQITFAIARDGESYLGSFLRQSQTGGPDRHLVAWSDDFLQTFHFHEFLDGAHVDAVAGAEAFFFLRSTATGCALYRKDLPPTRIAVVPRLALSLSARTQIFPPLVGSEPVTKTFLDLAPEPVPGTFVQIETSTDLQTWVPLGLPHPSTQVLTVLLGADSKRFFR